MYIYKSFHHFVPSILYSGLKWIPVFDLGRFCFILFQLFLMKCNLPISSLILLYNLSYLVWRGEHRHSSGVILREKLQKAFVTSDLPCPTQDVALPENGAQGMRPGPQFALSHNGGTPDRTKFMLGTKPSIFNFNFHKSRKNIQYSMGNWIKWLLHVICFCKSI